MYYELQTGHWMIPLKGQNNTYGQSLKWKKEFNNFFIVEYVGCVGWVNDLFRLN